MTTFPALVPGSRTFSPAAKPHSIVQTVDLGEIRMTSGDAYSSARLTLLFSLLTSAEMISIKDHYQNQFGTFLAFALSAEVLQGENYLSLITPTGHNWLYAASPRVTDIPIGTAVSPLCLHNVELELRSTPTPIVTAAGSRLTLYQEWLPGVTGFPGFNITLTSQWLPGTAS